MIASISAAHKQQEIPTHIIQYMIIRGIAICNALVPNAFWPTHF